MISFICGIYFKKRIDKTKQKQTHRYREQVAYCQKGDSCGEENYLKNLKTAS